MKRRIAIVILFLLTYSVFSQSANKGAEEKLNLLIDLQLDGNYNAAFEYLNADVQKLLSAKKLASSWEKMTSTYGEYLGKLSFRSKRIAEGNYFSQGIEFKNQNLQLTISLDSNEKIKSYRFEAFQKKYDWTAPRYADSSEFEVKKIKVGTAQPLLGELCWPKKQQLKNVVIMVHGSGPNDQDESLGPNKLFKDLAYGLASEGIASIRYNKRSYDYPAATKKNLNKTSIQTLIIDDAVLAIQKARALGAGRVFLAAHSLGGHLAPMIAETAQVEGVILLAANSSPLEDLILPQLTHIMENDTTTTINEFQYNALKFQVENLKNGNYDSTTVGPILPFGLPGFFWLSLKDYDAVETSQAQRIPYLILNGERDYQVPPSEAYNWKNGTPHRWSKTIIYKYLNHMFYSGKGVLIPSEYEIESHLEKVVLDDIVNWIKYL